MNEDILYSTIVVKQVANALEAGGRLLDSLPHQIGKLLDGFLWREWKNYKGEIVRCETFQGFLGIVEWNVRKVESLLSDDPKIRNKWREAMKMQGDRTDLKDADFCNNVTEVKAITGNSKSYTLSRLEKQHPESLLSDDLEIRNKWREAMLLPEGAPKENQNAAKNKKTTGNNVTGCSCRITGNSRSYTESRLKRENPELFKRVCDKEISANAAAIQAGWRKVKTPIEKAVDAFGKLTIEEMEIASALISEIQIKKA